MGIVNIILVTLMTEKCEISSEEYSQVPQDENTLPQPQTQAPSLKDSAAATNRLGRARNWLAGNLSQISAPTRSVMYTLWFLLAVDSLADGMVPYSLTNYYMDIKFHPSKSTLGDLTSASYFLGAIGSSFAGPLARRIGLINTMVFTHIPSSAAVLFFAAPPYFWMTAFLLLLRTALNPMDQAPRTSFIAAVVKPEERTAVMGITGMVRTLASMAGPTVTGALAAGDKFWIAFVAAGTFRLAYDVGLYAMFVNMKVGDDKVEVGRAGQDREEIELESPRFSLDSGSGDSDEDFEWKDDRQKRLGVVESHERMRSRSPHRVVAD